MRISPFRPLVVSVLVASFATPSFSQALPKLGAGFKVSTLGIGIEGATAVSAKTNVRAGVNFLGYDRDFSENGIDYAASMKLRSVEAHYDVFLGAFRFSPGLLVYNGNRGEGAATVAGGRSFNVGGRNYFSSTTDPVKGTARIDFSNHKVAPMLTAGVGNLLRREGRRLSITFEGGVVFQGSAKAALNLAGSACATTAAGPCSAIASNAQIQSDIRAEEAKINNGTAPYDSAAKVLKYYPMLSIGIGFRIK